MARLLLSWIALIGFEWGPDAKRTVLALPQMKAQ